MALREEFEQEGNWLFRWRSYLPLLIIILMLFTFPSLRYPLMNPTINFVWDFVCLSVSLLGLIVRFVTVAYAPRGTSGRNTQGQVALELNTTGMYSVVRHPLYLGNFLIWIGISLAFHSGWFLISSALIFWLYYERIMFAEEEFLRRKFQDTYINWSLQVPAFFPNMKAWRPPEEAMNVRAAIGSEYQGLFAIISAFTVIEIIKNSIMAGRFLLDFLWLKIFLLNLVFYLIIRMIKKNTPLLSKKQLKH